MNNLRRFAATITVGAAVAMTAIAADAQGIPGAVAAPSAEPATAPAAVAPAAPGAAAAAPALSPAAVAEAQAKWQNLCSTCHGALGKGDGPAGMALQPRPRDLSNAAWQAEKTDAHIEKVILEGGHAVGLSILMPANPDLANKPEVVKALRTHVRGLAGK